MTSVFDPTRSPAALRKLDCTELPRVTLEIRERIIDVDSRTSTR